ncbi:unnamed protein product [Amoebophrya sp. A120]|nr:unnamed protein product [Amoebophrya sp. A120]|eukprot:GSA120T00000218001.1
MSAARRSPSPPARRMQSFDLENDMNRQDGMHLPPTKSPVLSRLSTTSNLLLSERERSPKRSLIESPRIAGPIDKADTARILELKNEELEKKDKELQRLQHLLSEKDTILAGNEQKIRELALSHLGQQDSDSLRLTRHFPEMDPFGAGKRQLPTVAAIEQAAHNHLRFKDKAQDEQVLKFVCRLYLEGLTKVQAGEWKRCLQICEHLQRNLAKTYASNNWTVTLGWYSYSVSNADKYLLIDCDTHLGTAFPRIFVLRGTGDVVFPKSPRLSPRMSGTGTVTVGAPS